MSAAAPTSSSGDNLQESRRIMLGGYAALAESAWMGFAQATEVLEPLLAAAARVARGRPTLPRVPRLRLGNLLRREFTIAEASFLLMAGFFLSAALGAVRQVLFNAQFGVGMAADAYYAAFRLPDTLFSLIAGGALSSAMIPVLIRTTREDGPEAGQRLTRLVLTALFLFFLGLVLLVALLTPAFVRTLLAPGFDAATGALTATLTRIMLLQPLILVLGSVATAVLNSRNRFFLTGLSVISHNVALIAGILAARLWPGVGVLGPTLGVVAGAVLQVIILAPGLRDVLPGLRPAWDWRDARLRQVVRLLVPNGLAVSVNYAGFIVDTSFATRAPEAAALPAIYNAFLMVGLPIALLGQAVGQAAFPRLAIQAENGDWRTMRRTLLRALGSVVVLSIPIMLGFLFLGRQTIRLLFEHGRYDAAAGDLTYRILMVYAVALPAYVATEVVTRGLIALGDTRTPLLTNTVQLLGRAGIINLLLGGLGGLAIPAALAITATLEAVALSAVLLFGLSRRRVTDGLPAPGGELMPLTYIEAPELVAHYEKAGWEAYYDRKWLRAFWLLVNLNRRAFHMPWPRSVAAALDTVRASMAFAPLENNDIPRATRYLARFYDKAGRTMHLAADGPTLARLEMDYWVVHRQLALRRQQNHGDDDIEPLVQSLTALHVALFGAGPTAMRPSAEWRARAAVAVDRITGNDTDDVPAEWRRVETCLQNAYRAARQALLATVHDR